MYRVGNRTFSSIQDARAYDYATNGTISNVRSVAAPVSDPAVTDMTATKTGANVGTASTASTAGENTGGFTLRNNAGQTQGSFNTLAEATEFLSNNPDLINLGFREFDTSTLGGETETIPLSTMDRLYNFLTGSGGRSLAGIGLLTGAYEKLGGIGERGLELGEQLAAQQMAQATFRPYTVATTTGGQFGTKLTPVQRTYIDPVTGEEKSITEERLSTTLELSPEEQAIQSGLLGRAGRMFGATPGAAQLQQAGLGALGRGQQLMATPTFGIDPTRAAAEQAFGLGGRFMTAAEGQPADINLLRGQFAGQVPGLLTQEPSAGIGSLGQQALDLSRQRLGLGEVGILGGPVTDVTETFSDIQLPGVRTAAGALAGDVMGAGAAERGRVIPDISQTFAGITPPGVRTGAGALAARGLGLGIAGLDTTAPADVEALRGQYGGLAGQAAAGVLQPTGAREAEVFERIRATQRPEEERQRLALEERLAAQGRLGVRSAAFGGATPEQLALAKAQEEAQDRASLAAIQQAQAERQQALGEAQAFGGMFTQQAGLSSQLQSQAQQRAAQLSQLGLSAEQAQAQLEAEGFGRQLQLGQAGIQAAQAQSALRSQAQQRANELSQLGLSAEQVQSRLDAEGFGRQMQLAGAGLQAQQAQSALESQAQQRATQLAQLGLSAEQIESQLQSEGLGRAAQAAGQTAQLAQLAGGLQAQQAGLGAQYAGLGANLAQQRQALNTARQAQALQAMQAGQGLLGGGIGLQGARQQLGLTALGGAYLPQAQLLSALTPGQTAAAAAQQAQLYGTGLFGEATASGIDALLGASLGQANLIGTAGSGLLSGATSPSGAGTGEGVLGTGKGFSEFLDDVIGLDPSGGGLFRIFNRGGG